MKVVNLSSRPFVNERPVVRLSVLLWVLGVTCLVMNVYSYSTYWSDSKEVRGEISDLRQSNEEKARELSSFSQKISGTDLSKLNAHADFLNDLIRFRTFPWSRLFDSLEEVLPYDVRLASVQPKVDLLSEMKNRRGRTRPASRTRRSSRRTPPTSDPAPEVEEAKEIELELRGFAKNEEVILELVETLFEHPLFRDPDFMRENPDEQSRVISFDIKVTYLLDLRPDSATQEAEPDLAEASGPEAEQDATTADGASAAGGQELAGVSQAQPAPGPAAQEQLTPPRAAQSPPVETETLNPLVADDDARSGARAVPERRQPAARTQTRKITPGQPVRRLPGTPAAGVPAAGVPTAGTPAAGTPAAGTPAAGTTVMTPTVTPSAGTPSGAARPADRPAPPGRRPLPRSVTPRRPERPTAPPTDTEDDPRVRPRFVEPSASGAARLGGSN